jgi:hypothetical protein
MTSILHELPLAGGRCHVECTIAPGGDDVRERLDVRLVGELHWHADRTRAIQYPPTKMGSKKTPTLP